MTTLSPTLVNYGYGFDALESTSVVAMNGGADMLLTTGSGRRADRIGVQFSGAPGATTWFLADSDGIILSSGSLTIVASYGWAAINVPLYRTGCYISITSTNAVNNTRTRMLLHRGISSES
jgi:hypothetical protein